MTARGLFVTGTDTGVGKTWTSCVLLHALRSHDLRAAGMKPVASGCRATLHGLRNDDAEALIDASEPRPTYNDCNPFAFAEPIAPHLAASFGGTTITAEPIHAAYARLAAQSDRVVVEGVGGWAVPLSNEWMQADLVDEMDLPVVLVVGLRLGCINHALLTARAIAADGCRLIGWIANRIDPDMAFAAANTETLRQRIVAPLLGVLDHAPDGDAAHAAASLDVRAL
ncbi:MAG: dethiobiotin synthase [Dokdonella sp.]|uniref:dethiobiotin synthase n=1 Tax=Dokdonella sp. TaxID=2291710 RepID=UPI003267AD07